MHGERKKSENGDQQRFARENESGRIPSHAARRDGPDEGRDSFLSQVLSQAAPYMGASWVLTAGLVLGGLGGRWLDQKLGTHPWLLITGLLLGFVVGMTEVARVAFKRDTGKGS
jgi:F0F1-type ATP synthase assembly protein I